jgi:hypothetical protein
MIAKFIFLLLHWRECSAPHGEHPKKYAGHP